MTIHTVAVGGHVTIHTVAMGGHVTIHTVAKGGHVTTYFRLEMHEKAEGTRWNVLTSWSGVKGIGRNRILSLSCITPGFAFIE